MLKRPASMLEMGESPAQSKRKRSTESAVRETAAPADKASPAPVCGTSGIVLPSLVAITPWTASEISSELPPLPQILDPELGKTAFTHPGMGFAQSYERLEWLGDAYIELIASSLIIQTFRQTPSGRCSQLRELLVRNTTLAQYFRQYNMHLKARIPHDLLNSGELGRGRSRDKDQIKVQGDIFEAYVAAVIVSDPKNGLTTVVSWLKALWGQTISKQITENEKDLAASQLSSAKKTPLTANTSDLNAKDALRAAVGAKGVSIRYEDIPGNSKNKDLGLPLFTVSVYLDGWGETNKLLGTGTALQKKEAGHKAAKMALENKKLMRMYGAKKRAFQEALQKAAKTAELESEQRAAS